MNEDYFDKLSDVELRHELRKCGFANVPITETTRYLLIKKLKNYVLSNSQTRARNHRTSTRSIPQPATTSTTLINTAKPAVNLQNAAVSIRKQGTPSPSRRQTSYHSPANGYHNPYQNDRSSMYPANDFRAYDGYDNCGNGSLPTVRYGLANASSSTNYRLNESKTSKLPSKIYIPPTIIAPDLHPAVVSQERERIQHNDKDKDKDKDSPGVVSRLLKLRDITIKRSPVPSVKPTAGTFNRSHLYLSDSDSDTSMSTRYLQRHPSGNCSWFKHKLLPLINLKRNFKQSSIPFLLTSSFALFFVLLALLYLNKSPDMPSTMLERSTSFTTCEDLQRLTPIVKPSLNCIHADLVSNAIDLNRNLIQLLQTKTELHFCKDRSVSPEISAGDFIKYLYTKRSNDAHKLLRNFHAAIYLIEQNPQWKIFILNKSSDESTNLPDIYRQDIRFYLNKPHLPLKCILLNKMHRFFVIIGTVFLIGLLAAFIYIIGRCWQHRRQQYSAAVENFIKEIVREVMYRASMKDDNGCEVILVHLRDKLIPINKRQQLMPAWNAAIRTLEMSESRIQFGNVIRNGEEFRCMKWTERLLSSTTALPTAATAAAMPAGIMQYDQQDVRPRRKQWQSPAFDNVNNIFEPPTSCLKVRHMFDADEANQADLKQSIIESILEKVGPQCKILDVQLDRQTCCVYIRCASEADAGIVHREINGWWFDNRLVSIKFLRLQRYLTRFPNSQNSLISLRQSM